MAGICFILLLWGTLCTAIIVNGSTKVLTTRTASSNLVSNSVNAETQNSSVPILTTRSGMISSPLSTGIVHVISSVVNNDSIETDTPGAGGSEGKARPDPNHAGGSDDAGSKIRTIFFEIVGACIGVATLVVAVLALRRMPKQKLPSPESPPLRRNDNLAPQFELDEMDKTVGKQSEEPTTRIINAQASVSGDRPKSNDGCRDESLADIVPTVDSSAGAATELQNLPERFPHASATNPLLHSPSIMVDRSNNANSVQHTI